MSQAKGPSVTVDEALLKRVASVARVDLTESELKEFLPQLKDVLNWFAELEKVDVSKVQPAIHPVPVRDVLRPDKVEPCWTQAQALANVRQQENGFIKAPRIL